MTTINPRRTASLMKKGLRLAISRMTWWMRYPTSHGFPDEEGIETGPTAQASGPRRWPSHGFPDEEGIETADKRRAVEAALKAESHGFPDEEGIETSHGGVSVEEPPH